MALEKSPKFAIGAVAKLTGLPLDTLRVWERRYGVVTPERDGRGRLYSEGDVRRLQQLAAAVARGHAIGRLARLSEAALQTLLAAQASPSRPAPRRADAGDARDRLAGLIAALHGIDVLGLDRELGRLSLTMTPRDLIYRVVLPVLRYAGDEWQAGRLTPGQEHLLSAALRNLIGGIARLATPDGVATRLLFATPAGERHEFGILSAALLAALSGLSVIYAGADLPAAQIVDLAVRTDVRVVVLGVVYEGAFAQSLIEMQHVATQLPGAIELWIGGRVPDDAYQSLTRTALNVLPDLPAYESQLERIGGRLI